jgi:hypothetical protein
MRWPGFIGPSAVNRSVNVNAERTINLYPERTDGGAMNKAAIVLHGTPGVQPYIQAGSGPVRALWAQDGRCFCVSGGRLMEVFDGHRAVTRGLVLGGASPATISSNGTGGHQLLITATNAAYIFDLTSHVFTELHNRPDLSTPETPVSMGCFLDCYFLLLVAQSPTFRLSGLEDGLTWDPLDVQQRSYSTDNLRAMVTNHRELWLFGSRTTEVWYDTGDADMPFQPVQGAFLEAGIAAPWSAVRIDNAILWVGADERGVGVVWRANGYTPQRVSTHALELALGSVTLEQARAYAYQDEGHAFYVLYVPDLETTWVYDVASGLWHERAHWDTDLMRWIPHLGVCHAHAFGRHLVGDRTSGVIYEMDLDLYDDEIV